MYNQVTMIGNLTRDIETKSLPSGGIVAKTAIATTYKFKSATGEQKEEVCFLEVAIFGVYADVAVKFLKKGSKVLFIGRLVFEQWTAQDGSARSRHSLRVTELKMLDSKSNNNSESNNTKTAQEGQKNYYSEEDLSEYY